MSSVWYAQVTTQRLTSELENLKEERNRESDRDNGRRLSLAYTHLETAIMWLEKVTNEEV